MLLELDATPKLFFFHEVRHTDVLPEPIYPLHPFIPSKDASQKKSM